MSGYLGLLFFFGGGFLFLAVGFGVSRWLQNAAPNAQKLASYECGEEAIPNPNQTIPFRFYLPALLFLVFEVEVVLLAPVLVARFVPPADVNDLAWAAQLKVFAFIFIAILTVGYLLAWALGYLEWDRPQVKPVAFEGSIPDFAYEQYNLEITKSRLAAKLPASETAI